MACRQIERLLSFSLLLLLNNIDIDNQRQDAKPYVTAAKQLQLQLKLKPAMQCTGK